LNKKPKVYFWKRSNAALPKVNFWILLQLEVPKAGDGITDLGRSD
jgi:hypothetical protein